MFVLVTVNTYCAHCVYRSKRNATGRYQTNVELWKQILDILWPHLLQPRRLQKKSILACLRRTMSLRSFLLKNGRVSLTRQRKKQMSGKITGMMITLKTISLIS